eukprot:685981-Pyramimonas_sp.AAC.1
MWTVPARGSGRHRRAAPAGTPPPAGGRRHVACASSCRTKTRPCLACEGYFIRGGGESTRG